MMSLHFMLEKSKTFVYNYLSNLGFATLAQLVRAAVL